MSRDKITFILENKVMRQSFLYYNMRLFSPFYLTVYVVINAPYT